VISQPDWTITLTPNEAAGVAARVGLEAVQDVRRPRAKTDDAEFMAKKAPLLGSYRHILAEIQFLAWIHMTAGVKSSAEFFG
jgi:hypothetical protein